MVECLFCNKTLEGNHIELVYLKNYLEDFSLTFCDVICLESHFKLKEATE